MSNKKNESAIIQSINFDLLTKSTNSIVKIENELKLSEMPKALYRGILPIGEIQLDCAVLDNKMRILSASSIFKAFGRPSRGNSRLKINGIKIPAFMDAKNLEKHIINQNVMLSIKSIEYLDGNQKKKGYVASLLPKVCEIYLSARRANDLIASQEKLAAQSEILISALAHVGIDALVDEATGFQHDRKHDALRILLSKYIAEGLQEWIKTFPNSFFVELDKLYGNNPTTSRKRPQYYGRFINTYVYNPIENGYVKSGLNELNILPDGKRKARFHQWLSDGGKQMLARQIGKIEGIMLMCHTIDAFKRAVKKQQQISIAPYLFDEMNQIIED